MHKTLVLSIINVIALCIVISAISLFFVHDNQWIGYILIALSVLCLLSLAPFKIPVRSVQPDIIFGLIDNGILAILAIFGAHFAGVTGAILGGVVGNALTDGIAGVFEGHWAENLRNKAISEERTLLKSAVGKMAGCLLGAGIVMVIASWLKF